MHLKDAISFAQFKGNGLIEYRDGDHAATVTIDKVRKEGAYLIIPSEDGDAQVPLHRIIYIDVDGERVFVKGVGQGK